MRFSSFYVDRAKNICYYKYIEVLHKKIFLRSRRCYEALGLIFLCKTKKIALSRQKERCCIVENNTVESSEAEEIVSLRIKNKVLRRQMKRQKQVAKMSLIILFALIIVLVAIIAVCAGLYKTEKTNVRYTFVKYNVQDGEGLYEVSARYKFTSDVRDTMGWIEVHNKIRYVKGEAVLERGQVLTLKVSYEQAKKLVDNGQATYLSQEEVIERNLH